MRGEQPSAAPQSVSACLLEAQRWYRGMGSPEAQAFELFPARMQERLELLAQHQARRNSPLLYGSEVLVEETEADKTNWAGYTCMRPVEVKETLAWPETPGVSVLSRVGCDRSLAPGGKDKASG
jgi:hypothetical protein